MADLFVEIKECQALKQVCVAAKLCNYIITVDFLPKAIIVKYTSVKRYKHLTIPTK